MRNWNTHSWYVTGILCFLLIWSVAIQWNAIPDLPGVISFALGLSSLLLALIAIVQSLTGGADISAGLSAINRAANDVQKAAEQIQGLGGQMLVRTGELGELLEKNTASSSNVSRPVIQHDQIDLDVLPYGGTLALYAAAWSAQTGKSFNMAAVQVDKNYVSAAFQDGFLSALMRLGFLVGSIEGGDNIVTDVRTDPIALRDNLRKRVFSVVSLNEFQSALSKIDHYFTR